MLTLTHRQLVEKLPAWIDARLSVAIIGPPGTGKTYTSRKVATETGRPVEVVDGGNETSWKGLFPYKTPAGEIELGTAIRASGGVLIVDEFNRVPPELKSAFQLLASEKIVPWPEGGVRDVDLAIIATANDADLGVEEAARAELDRYDLIVKLTPSPAEIGAIVASGAGVKPEVATVIYEAVVELSGKLDPKKFHLPEGIRMAISIARVLRSVTLGPADAFRGAAERCFPLGRRGADRTRAEFDAVVADVAGRFGGRIANLGQLEAQPSTATPTPQGGGQSSGTNVSSLQQLKAVFADSLEQDVSTPALPLPLPFMQMMHVFTQSFGAGVSLHLLRSAKSGGSAERRGVKVTFGQGTPDVISFTKCPRHQVEVFLRLVLN